MIMIQHRASSLETTPRRRRFARIGSIATALVATALLALGTASPANAAYSHHTKDPYSTGCAASKWALSSKAVPGGTVTVMVSNACGTNWIEYRGKAQYTSKNLTSYNYGSPGYPETDTTAWAYSMQVYAPGTTSVTATVHGAGWTAWARCASTCTWTTY